MTGLQDCGSFGGYSVKNFVSCPKCKSEKRTLKDLPPNFKGVDLVCDFCGYLEKVKTSKQNDFMGERPNSISGAAWGPQQERMNAGIYFPLFIAAVGKKISKTHFFTFPLIYERLKCLCQRILYLQRQDELVAGLHIQIKFCALKTR